MAVEILLKKRSHTQHPHTMLVRALNIPHTHRVATLLEENFPVLKGRVGVIHSAHDEYDLAGRPSAILERLHYVHRLNEKVGYFPIIAPFQ